VRENSKCCQHDYLSFSLTQLKETGSHKTKKLTRSQHEVGGGTRVISFGEFYDPGLWGMGMDESEVDCRVDAETVIGQM
jgi:hypothetical protein